MPLKKLLGFFLLITLLPGSQSQADSSPVIVELFTSQGCSSCPPAEEFLSAWGMSAFQSKQIIPLAFHVDYWDSLGWKDPFSSSQATARQEYYASFLKSRSLYTPQMVVSGSSAFVGSDQDRATREVSRFSKTSPSVQINIHPAWNKNSLRLQVHIKAVEKAGPRAAYRVIAAVFENKLVTQVLRGENAGKTLINDFVVRTFTEAGVFDTELANEFSKIIDFAWSPAWKKENSGLTVFVQDQKTFVTGPGECVFPVVSPE